MATIVSKQTKTVKIDQGNWSRKTDRSPWTIGSQDQSTMKMAYIISWVSEKDKLPNFKKNSIYQIDIIKEDNKFGLQYTISLENDPVLLEEEKEVVIDKNIHQDTPDITTIPIIENQVVKYEDNSTELITISDELSIDLAIRNFRLYEYVMNEIVNPEDYSIIQNKKFLRKSGFKKLALAFNISDPKIEFKFIDENTVQVIATAVSQNGRISMDVAICEMSEISGPKTKHNLLTKAVTRAKSRVISNLVGCGLVSFEEVS